MLFSLMGWVGAILGFGFLVLIHEGGHFWALKAMKLPVHAFSIGFGSPIWSRKIGGTEWRLGWIPLGGYVMPEDPAEVEKREAAGEALLPNYPPLSHMFVAFMGPFANLVLAVIFFTILISFWGEPHPVPKVESPVKGSPAFVAGIVPGDRLVAFHASPIKVWQDLIDLVQSNGGHSSLLEIERQGKNMLLPITPIREGDRFVLGIRPCFEPTPPAHFFAALRIAVTHTMTETLGVFHSLKNMISMSGSGNVSGPVAILGMASDAARGGMFAFLSLLAILSINLAVFNLLPIPPLDGLRILVACWQLVFGAPPREKILLPMYQWGALGLALLFLVVTLKDLGNFFL